jgi:cation/acetate symporter
MFLAFVIATLVITYWAAGKAKGANQYFAAGRSIKGWQNGIAVAGDYMSAASFLGITGMIANFGYDGFMYSVGWLVAYLTVLLVVAKITEGLYCRAHGPQELLTLHRLQQPLELAAAANIPAV